MRGPGPFEVQLGRRETAELGASVPELPEVLTVNMPIVSPLPVRPSRQVLQIVSAPALEHDQSEKETLPYRDFECGHYDTCLSLSAALDWSSFTCQGCSHEVDEKLLWRAHSKVRQDDELARFCHLPQLRTRK